MGITAVLPSEIISVPALSILGNSTGSTGSAESLNGTQVRTILGLGTTDTPQWAGATLTGDLLFSANNTYDVGNGTYNPRTVRAATSVLTPLLNNTNAAALIVGNSTYGVTVPGKLSIGRSPSVATTAFDVYNATSSVQATIQSGNNFCELLLTSGSSLIPNYITSNGNLSFIVGVSERLLINQSTGAATFSGDISMQKTSAQGYIRSHGPGVVSRYTEMYHDDSRGYVTSNFGGLYLNPDGHVRVSEIAAVSSGGQIKIGYNYSTYVVMNGFINYGADVRIYSKTTTSHALGLMGLSGQTAALFECQDNGGSDLFTVEVTGASRNWSSGQTKYTQTIHDGTNGILSTSSGNLRFELGSAGGYYDFPGVVATGNTVRIWNNTNTAALQLRHTGNGQIESSAGKLTLIASAAGKWIELQPNSGLVDHYTAGTNSVYRAWNAQGNGYVEITHDITNGIVSTVNTANLNLVPAGGTVAVTGAVTTTGDISMSKTSAQGYIRAYGTGGVNNIAMYHDGQGRLSSSTGGVYLTPADGMSGCYTPLVHSTFIVYSSDATHNVSLASNGINGILSTSSGNLNLVPTGGTVAVTGAVTTTGDISMSHATQGYIRAYAGYSLGRNTNIYHDTSNGYVNSSHGGLFLTSENGNVHVDKLNGLTSNGMIRFGYNVPTWVVFNGQTSYNAGVRIYSKTTTDHALGISGLPSQTAALFECQDSGGNDLFTVEVTGASRNWSSLQTKYTQTIHDGTNGILSTSSGALVLSPATSIIGLGGITSSFPAIKRSSTTFAVRLGDDSADAPISCAGITASGNVSFTGGLTTGFVTKVADYTLTVDDHTVCVTANSITVTLETSVGCAGREHEIINTGAGTVTLNTTSAQTISGNASGALTLAQWKSIRVKSDGSNWLIMSQVT